MKPLYMIPLMLSVSKLSKGIVKIKCKNPILTINTNIWICVWRMNYKAIVGQYIRIREDILVWTPVLVI
jgi:hypothetical protein